MGYLHRFQGCLLSQTNTGTVQKISEISYPGSDIPVQGTAFRIVHSTHRVHCDSKGGETDGHTQQYKDPPYLDDRLVRTRSHQACLQAYSGTSRDLSEIRLAGECGEMRVGPQTSLRLHTITSSTSIVAGSDRHRTGGRIFCKKYSSTFIPTGLSGLAIHVSYRYANGHRKASSPRPTTYETHTVASQKQMDGSGITRKGHSFPQVLAPHLKWWLEESNVLLGQPLHPIKHALQIFTDASKEGWGTHLNENTARGTWSLPESKLHVHYLEVKAVFLALKEFQDLCSDKIVLVATDNNTVVSYINKEGGLRSGSLCALLWRILTWCARKQVNSKLDTFQALFDTRFNNQLPLFVLPVPDPLAWAVDALSLPWEDLDAYAFPAAAIMGKVVEKLQIYPCRRIILIAPGWPNMPWFWDLVAMSSQIPLSLPNLLTEPFNLIPHKNLTNPNLHAWLLEP